ncbi:MAG: DUF188 domain-containing protein [Treponema sp.]|nr:DUF188 domain-containing protein [Treponema sp.]
MKILVDADSCPRSVRTVIIRAAERVKKQVFFVANRPIPGLYGSFARMELCLPVAGAADEHIVALAEHSDIVITRDISLASRLVERSITVLDDRGRVFTQENVRYVLSIRNFVVNLAEHGLDIERTARYGKKELKVFADTFDRLLTHSLKGEDPCEL